MDAKEARKLSCEVTTNLAVIERITDKQRAALVNLLQDSKWVNVRVHWSFDLPEGWLYVMMVDYACGISPEGEVHS